MRDMTPEDCDRRMEYGELMLGWPKLFENILWSDEAVFHIGGFVNRDTVHKPRQKKWLPLTNTRGAAVEAARVSHYICYSNYGRRLDRFYGICVFLNYVDGQRLDRFYVICMFLIITFFSLHQVFILTLIHFRSPFSPHFLSITHSATHFLYRSSKDGQRLYMFHATCIFEKIRMDKG